MSTVRYFVTVEDQDAVIGRLMREKKATEVKRAALQAEAERIATNLHSLASHLDKRLSGIQLQGASLGSDFLSSAVWVTAAELEEPKRIIQLADEYRETISRHKTISKQLREAGIE
jgi:hypothetical protein